MLIQSQFSIRHKSCWLHIRDLICSDYRMWSVHVKQGIDGNFIIVLTVKRSLPINLLFHTAFVKVPVTPVDDPSPCCPSRHLERAVVSDGPGPAAGMEEDHRHGRHLLLAHPHGHHAVGEAGSPHRTHGPAGPGWRQLNSTQTLAGFAQLLTNTRPWGECRKGGKLKNTKQEATAKCSKRHKCIDELRKLWKRCVCG